MSNATWIGLHDGEAHRNPHVTLAWWRTDRLAEDVGAWTVASVLAKVTHAPLCVPVGRDSFNGKDVTLIAPSFRLNAIHRAITSELQSVGYVPTFEPWRPHVTNWLPGLAHNTTRRLSMPWTPRTICVWVDGELDYVFELASA